MCSFEHRDKQCIHSVSHHMLLYFPISIPSFISMLLIAAGSTFIVLFLFYLSNVIDVHCKNFQKVQKGKKNTFKSITSPARSPTVIIFIQTLHVLLLCFCQGGMWMTLAGYSLPSMWCLGKKGTWGTVLFRKDLNLLSPPGQESSNS